jgi:hypothetical protein
MTKHYLMRLYAADLLASWLRLPFSTRLPNRSAIDTPHGLKPDRFSVLRGLYPGPSPKTLPAPLYVLGRVVVPMQAGSTVRATVPADG